VVLWRKPFTQIEQPHFQVGSDVSQVAVGQELAGVYDVGGCLFGYRSLWHP
jgi:hypothetical protein